MENRNRHREREREEDSSFTRNWRLSLSTLGEYIKYKMWCVRWICVRFLCNFMERNMKANIKYCRQFEYKKAFNWISMQIPLLPFEYYIEIHTLSLTKTHIYIHTHSQLSRLNSSFNSLRAVKISKHTLKTNARSKSVYKRWRKSRPSLFFCSNILFDNIRLLYREHACDKIFYVQHSMVCVCVCGWKTLQRQRFLKIQWNNSNYNIKL